MRRLLNLSSVLSLFICLTLLLSLQTVVSFAQEVQQPASLLSESASMAAGDAHTCALTSANNIVCWGANANGQLGIGSFIDQSLPVLVTGIVGNASAVVAGERHACALLDTGAVRCWGANEHGQLGNPISGDQSAPVDVVGLPDPAIALATGANHTCAVLNQGSVYCWGNNSVGQLNGSAGTDSVTPILVPNLAPAISVAAGSEHSCALLQSGSVSCWGSDAFGQLGDGPNTVTASSTSVINLAPGVQFLSAGGGHTCAATNTGILQCWGHNNNGQLGDGSLANQAQPITVTNTSGALLALSLGPRHTCLATLSNGLYCWGDNSSGQLGDNTTVDKSLPQKVVGLNGNVQDVATGNRHTCARLIDGSLNCWGRNYNGQLGNGEDGRYPLPVDVVGLTSGVGSLVAASNSTCARVNGAAKCWGSNSNGQLGDSTRRDRTTPVSVVGLSSGVILLSSDGKHSCATTSSEVLCWGNNSNGQLGDGSNIDRLTPTVVDGINGAEVMSIVIGDLHSCALFFTGDIKCWGSNSSGQLGDGSNIDRNKPVKVKDLGGYATSVSAGAAHSCSRLLNGIVKCWGSNTLGQLGDGTKIDHILPAPVTGFDQGGAASVTASETHSCARLTGNTGVRCWGNNAYGQLGDNSIAESLTPVDVVGLSNVGGMTVGRFHNCVLNNNEMSCWGDNRYGQLGDGTLINRLVPVKVKSLNGAINGIGAGGSQTCALISNAMHCWGNDEFGQIGNGVEPDRYVPTMVEGFLELRPRRTRTPVPSITATSIIVPTAIATTVTPKPIDETSTPFPSITPLPNTPTATPQPNVTATATPQINPTPSPTGQIDPPQIRLVYAPLTLRDFPVYFDGSIEREDNDQASAANGPLRLNNDYLCLPDDANDYFRFVTPHDGIVTLSIASHVAENTVNVQLQLRSADDKSIAFVFKKPFTIKQSLPAGTYLARVFYAPPGPYSTTMPYSLRVGFE